MLKFFIDFFTFECNKPGSLSLRSPYKIFNETTHQIGQNSFLKFKMTNKLEIIQLTAPMKPPTNYLYFGLFSKYGKQIKISADYPPLFKDTIIEGDQVFLTKIDLYKYESDQLAIKLYAEESTELEAVEIIRYNFTEYTVLKDARKKKISDNHFIRFINPNTEEIKVKVNGLKNVEILFGFVQLFTNDINYLPMANKFEDGYLRRREINKKDSMKLKNPFLKNTDSRKKYLAFIFSIPEYKYYQYEAQVIQDGEEDEDPDVNILGIVLSIVGALILIVIIGIIVYYFWKKKKGEKAGKDEFINEDNEENYKNINDGENNKNNYEDNNINNNAENNINNKKKNVIHRFDDEDDENDKRLYKSFDDE
jgi:cbb3-type cytochrome oxidase subunit 3